MRTIKGPAIFQAQFAGDAAPHDSLPGIARWAAGHGYQGMQVPSWDKRLFDLALAAEGRSCCDEVRGVLREAGLIEAAFDIKDSEQGAAFIRCHIINVFARAFDDFAASGVDTAANRKLLGLA